MVLEGMVKKPNDLLRVTRSKLYCNRCGHEIMLKIPTFKRQSCFVTLCRCQECRRTLDAPSKQKPTG